MDSSTLSMVVDIQMGQSPPGHTYNEDGRGLPFFQGVRDFNYRFPTTRVYCTAPSRIADRGDILLSIRAPIGRVNVASERCATGRGIAIIRPRDVADARYIEFVLRNMESYWKILEGGGAVFGNAKRSDLESVRLPWPEKPCRHKIAAILSAYDDLIENNLRRIKILEEMAQNLYREWFVKFRFPGHQQARFVDSTLGRIPEGWKVTTLGTHCKLVMGQSPKSEFYNEDGKGLPFHQGVTGFGDHFPTDRVYCTITERIAEKGDILFSVRAPVGRINIALHRMVIGRGVAAIRTHDGHQSFLLYQIKEVFREEDSMGNGAIFKAVTKSDLMGVKLVKPTSTIISKFDDIANNIGLQIISLTLKNTTLRRTRDLLLPRLISGEVDVSELDIAVPEEAQA